MPLLPPRISYQVGEVPDIQFRKFCTSDEGHASVEEKSGIKIKVRVRSGFQIERKEGKLLTPDTERYSGRLEFTSADGYVQLEILHLKIYNTAAIYDPTYFI